MLTKSKTKYDDGRVKLHNPSYVPCGKCYACNMNKKLSWLFRFQVEEENSLQSYFVTLTYDNDHLTDVNKKHLQNYFRFLRREKHVFKYYAIGEYGTKTNRPHYHAAIFLQSQTQKKFEHDLEKKWNHGNILTQKLEIGSMNYVLHYHIRPKEPIPGKFTFSIMSKGLGSQLFENKTMLNHLQNIDIRNFVIKNRSFNSTYIPRYYRRKYNLIQKPCQIKTISDEMETIGENNFNYRQSVISTQKDKLLKYNIQEKF